jgi:hypothetical protein
MDEPWLVGALELGERIRRRDVSATEVVDAFIERIEAVDGDVNAVVVRAFDRARAEAAAADRRADDGTSLGALDGVPFTVKDVIETEGVATVAGLPERRTTVPAADAVVVARLRAAGAICWARRIRLRAARAASPTIRCSEGRITRTRSTDGWRGAAAARRPPRHTVRRRSGSAATPAAASASRRTHAA